MGRPIFRLRGRVEESTGEPAAGVFVAIVDADPDLDDLIAVGLTSPDGSYRASFTAEAFNQEAGESEATPDLYVVVSRVDGDSLTAVAREDFGKRPFAGEEDLGVIRLAPRFQIPMFGGTVHRAAPGRGKLAKRLRLDDEIVGLALEEVVPIVERLTGWSKLVGDVRFVIVDDFTKVYRARCERALGHTDLPAMALAHLEGIGRTCEASTVAEWDPVTSTVLLNRMIIETQGLDYFKSTLGHELVHVGQSRVSPDINARLVALQGDSWRHRAAGTRFTLEEERESTILLANIEGYADYIERQYLARIYTHAEPVFHAARKADERFRKSSGGWTAAEVSAMPLEELLERFGATKQMQYVSGSRVYASRSVGELPAPFDPELRPAMLPDVDSILGALVFCARAKAAQAVSAPTRKCAACDGTAPDAAAPSARLHTPVDSDGVDGRPGDEPTIEVCTSCGHLAPDIAAAYPRLVEVQNERPELLALPGHAPLALRCLVIANLFADHDHREEGKWALRAAWHDEAAGFAEAARPIRRRAAVCLEYAVYEGYALVPERSASSLVIAETFRVGGAFDRAFEHVLRGLRYARAAPERIRQMAIYQLHCVLERRSEPITCADALRGFTSLGAPRLQELSQRLEAALPALATNEVQLRRASMPLLRSLFDEAVVFAHDYADPRLMIDLLRQGRPGIWQAVLTRPRELLPALLHATGHAEPIVWMHALAELTGETFSFHASLLKGHEDAVVAVLRRMGEGEKSVVRAAAGIAKQIIFVDASFCPLAVVHARAALPNWKHDPALGETLEAIVTIAGRWRPPEPAAAKAPERRARNLPEMRFAASIRPCAACGKAPSDAKLDLFGAKNRYSLVGKCPHCNGSIAVAFVTDGDPNTTTCPPGELGDGRPSEIITPAELLGELTRVGAGERALLCIRELLKSPPEVLSTLGTPAGERVTADWLYGERARALAPAAPPLDRIVRILLDEAGPPPTVGALEQALGIVLTQAELANSASARVVMTTTREAPLGPHVKSVSASYVVRRPIDTLEALRARPLEGFTVVLAHGSEVVEGALRARFGAPQERPPHRVYHAWSVSAAGANGELSLSCGSAPP